MYIKHAMSIDYGICTHVYISVYIQMSVQDSLSSFCIVEIPCIDLFGSLNHSGEIHLAMLEICLLQ